MKKVNVSKNAYIHRPDCKDEKGCDAMWCVMRMLKKLPVDCSLTNWLMHTLATRSRAKQRENVRKPP